MRVKAVVAYDGSYFHGFQKQKTTQDTVTTAIESALQSLHIESAIVGSGRTDRGVHATGQVIHLDLPYFWSDLSKLKRELNRKLKRIKIKHITAVDEHFHARFSAKRRLYRYIFKRSKPSLFEENYISYYSSFDAEILHQALELLEGEHDFCHFHKTGSPMHSTVRHIYRARYREWDEYSIIYFEANGFLRSQVRMMVAAVMLCAEGHISLEMLREQISGSTRHTTQLAPPAGLYLARVYYT